MDIDIIPEDVYMTVKHVEQNGTIVEYPKYEVNAYGVVRNKETGEELPISNRGNSDMMKKVYQRVNFYYEETISKLLHRVVLSSFNPISQANSVVNHRDNDETNNKLSNLEWVTTGYNNLHAKHWHKRYGHG